MLPRLPPPATSDSHPIASVYYDNPSTLAAYHDRLRRDDGACVVRVRWYGDRDACDPQQQLFVERKVHREAYTGEYSSKDRAVLEQRFMVAFAAGERGLPKLANPTSADGELLREAQDLLTQGGMVRKAHSHCSYGITTSASQPNLHLTAPHPDVACRSRSCAPPTPARPSSGPPTI